MNTQVETDDSEMETQPSDVPVWKCPNCGQSYFGIHPPDLCDYCQDYTTWQRVKK